MHIVWICHAADSPADYPNYGQHAWRPVNGVQFAELDSYDIRGLSAMITRSIRHETIQYILGATGAACRLLQAYPHTPRSWINYVFIDHDKVVGDWIPSNPVLEDTLDLLSYCHRANKVSREPRPALRGNNYRVPGAVTNWANEARAPDELRGG